MVILIEFILEVLNTQVEEELQQTLEVLLILELIEIAATVRLDPIIKQHLHQDLGITLDEAVIQETIQAEGLQDLTVEVLQEDIRAEDLQDLTVEVLQEDRVDVQEDLAQEEAQEEDKIIHY